MLVVGHLDITTKDHAVVIPDFHKGHLGFLPQTSIKVFGPAKSGSKLYHSPERSCELIVTPFIINENIVRINCAFDEKIGVLERLVNLISYLGGNIVALESASLFRSRFHEVDLVVDLVESNLPSGHLSRSDAIRYAEVQRFVPVLNKRHLALYFHIVKQCHDILAWPDDPTVWPGYEQNSFPQVRIVPFTKDEHTTAFEASPATIDRGLIYEHEGHRPVGTRNKKHIYFRLNEPTIVRISTHLGQKPTDPFHYMLLSDTDSRSLRIQFFNEPKRKRLIEVGFLHKNFEGAMDVITRIVAQSNFNVLVSLLRRVQESKNVWEATLEYRGDPRDLQMDEDPRVVIQKLMKKTVQEHHEELSIFDVSLVVPSHIPGGAKYRSPGQPTFWLDTRRRSSPKAPMPTELMKPSAEVSERKQRLFSAADRMLGGKPKVFISYPKTADGLREALTEAIKAKGRWEVGHYKGNHGEELTYEEARRLILDCDYFLGIWHPEAKARKQISPWLHFEFGQALAFRKPFKIAADISLPQGVVRRVAADNQVFTYADEANFREETINQLLQFMDENWRVRDPDIPEPPPTPPRASPRGRPSGARPPGRPAPAPVRR